MARSIWNGNLSFGLVNIPVSLHAAEKSTELHFTLLDRRNLAPVHYRRVNERTGAEVPWEETVHGYEFEPDRYVVLTDDDLAGANPKSTQTIEIIDFVTQADIVPGYFDKPYYLAPERKAAKSYALLRETLRRTGKVGIAKVVLRTRQHLAAVAPVGDAMVLNLMRFADELRQPEDLDLDLPGGKQGVTEKELKMAERLVEAMVEPWKPDSYRDDYRVDVQAMIDARVEAGELEAAKRAPAKRRPAASRGKVVDLMALLKQSLAEGGAGQGRAAGGAKATSSAKSAKKAGAAAGAKSSSRKKVLHHPGAAGHRRARRSA